jgi:hypothetical protein
MPLSRSAPGVLKNLFRQIERPIGSLFPKFGAMLAGPFFVPA